MNPSSLDSVVPMRKILCVLFAVLTGHSFAIEVHLAKMVEPSSRLFQMGREYAFTTNDQPDDRLFFAAYKYDSGFADGCWTLQIFPRSEDVTFNEYLEAIYASVDRFAADVPDGKVCEVMLRLPHNGRLWAGLRAKLVPILAAQGGETNPEFPKEARRLVREYIKSSPRLHEIAADIGDRLKVHPRKVYAEGGLFVAGPQSLGKRWRDLVWSPNLGTRQIEVVMEFETGKDAGR